MNGGPLPGAGSLVGLLRGRAGERPERVAYLFLADGQEGEEESARLTFRELDRQARAIAAALQEQTRPGDRALLLFPPGLEFVAGFLGCLYAKVVAVPAYPPRLNRPQPRLRSIAADCRPAVTLTLAAIAGRAGAVTSHVPELAAGRWLAADELIGRPGLEEGWRDPGADGSTLAFLQYTSGSTSTPKGVMVSHGNLLHNEEMIRRAFGQTEDSVIASWLPLYHDMGLIGGVLQPLYLGARCILMSPMSFLQKPVRWLRAVSRYRATTSGGPNFAYELAAAKVNDGQLGELDLSSWDVAFNGAEPVRAETLRRFAERFAPCGFRRQAFFPCYGLAEATLFVSGGPREAPPVLARVDPTALEAGRAVPSSAPNPGRELVGCGGIWMDQRGTEQRIAIADPETREELPPGVIGEIWVSGPSVAQGYWERPDRTESDFRARLAGDARDEAFLRTGDLGFLHQGQLYVTGRIKDLIILRGRNLFPQDVELTAERHPDLRPGCGAAFAEDGDEALVVVYEVERRAGLQSGPEVIRERLRDTAEAVRRAVAEEHEAALREVVLVAPGTIPKTTSGKIRRHACRAAYRDGTLTVLARTGAGESAPLGEEEFAGVDRAALLALDPLGRGPLLEAWLRREVGRAAGVEPARIPLSEPLTALGLDSLAAVELRQAVEDRLRVALSLEDLLAGASLSRVAHEIGVRLREEPAEAPAGLAPEGPETGVFPLSHGQRALWFLERLVPGNAAYNLAGAARLRDPGLPALRHAFAALAGRHPALRTTFEEEGGDPRQRVHPVLAPGWSEEDARDWPQERLAARLEEEAWRPFDLAQGPLWRAALWRTGERDWTVLLAAHHLVADFWSLGVALRELGALYERETGGRRELPPPPAPRYTDFVRWQEGWLTGEAGERLDREWREALTGEPPGLDLPRDRPRPAVQSFRGGAHVLRLGPELSGGVRALGREAGATLFVTLLAAFQALLHRWTGEEDLRVGTPTAGRGLPGLDAVLGYFVNPVVIRGDAAGDPEFREMLARTLRTALAAFARADYPLGLLGRTHAGRGPYQVMLVLQRTARPEERSLAAFALKTGGPPMDLGGLVLEPLPLAERTAQLDLTVMAADLDDGLALSFQYSSDLFDAPTAARLAGHLRVLLAGAAADPRAPLSALPLLGAIERRQILAEWNATAGAPSRRACLHELVGAQAERTPAAVALEWRGERLSYRELVNRARALAARLRALGAGPEARVGVLLERTPDLAVALLAVLEAGGAYVPLDPAYPADRLLFLLEDADAAVLVTRSDLAARSGIAAGDGSAVLELDRLPEPPTALPASTVLPENLAYLIYTSGSTGRPKAVAIEHRSAVAMIDWAAGVFPAEDLDGVVASTSVGFDLSVFELFLPLSRGGRVILADNALDLASWSAAGAVLLNTVPSAAAEILRLGALPPSVRTVNLAGEPLKGSLARALYATGTVRRVFNLYGPSEDTTYSTFEPVPAGEEGEPTIGRPIANTRAWLLDRTGRPVPVGVPGELFLGGHGLARGYLGRPELTAERFLPNPFADEPGARLYRTGDLARYRADGRLEFLGRLDHQVKVRGFRIELGEIEAALARHVRVREAAVLAIDAGEDKRLVAWVAGSDPEPAELRRFLAERLPEPLIPSAFVVLDALPLTPNGKLDRKRLPPPIWTGRSEAARPRTPAEELVAGLWAELLGVPAAGPGDSFFDLGGHSLLATRAVARIRERLGIELPVRALFEAPTVAALAERIEAGLRARGGPQAPPLRPVPRTGEPLPASFAQERLWFLDCLEPGSPLYNVPAAVRLSGGLHVPALAGAAAEVVRRHEALRTRFLNRDGRPVQQVEPYTGLALPLVDLAGLPPGLREAEARRRREEEARRPFDLAAAPLVRATLLILEERERELLLTTHHIVSDGWSLGVFLRELAALYETFTAGRRHPPPECLPELAVQYPDFAVWQREWLRGETLAAELAWWQERLAGAPPLLALPLDRPRSPRPSAQSHRGAEEPLALAPELADRLRDLARREGVTLFMILLAAFDLLLARHSGESDLIVGTPVANRNRVETEALIGFFVNTLPLRADLAGGISFRELLARCRETTLGAYAHQDVPFEKLVEELQPERSLAWSPVFQVLLVLQNAPFEAPALPGLAVEPMAVATGTAKLDLTVELAERGPGLGGRIEYDRDLFDGVTVRRLAGHLANLLAGAAADPGARLSELPMLGEAERGQLRAWGEGPGSQPAAVCLHQLFEERAARHPDAPAVEGRGERLTYGELSRRAGHLANHLRARGAGPETRVGVLLERSPGLVAALLAVLKAGGAYVPLDPRHPDERLGLLLEDSGAALVLTRGGLAHRLAAGTAVVDLDDLGDEPAAAPGPPPSPGNLAYLIYTSGSTGRPKAVAIEHRSAVALVAWARTVFTDEELAGVLAATSTGFDLSVFEIFVPLSLGGRVVLADDALDLAAYATAGVTLINTVPSAIAEVLRLGALPASARTVNLAGEPLQGALAHRLHATGTVRRLLNLYGPSEDTTYSTFAEIPAGDGAEPAIGAPVAGTRAWLADRDGVQVPAGAAGELLLGGAGLARGYLGRPELTAERFVPDPFGGEPGARLYRTGDIARFRRDGALEYLGRIDHQVKIRGFRVEPGEVEALLAGHPAVREAAVATRPGPAGDLRLVAWVSPRHDPPPGSPAPELIPELAAFARQRLPEFLVPSLWLELPALPLTPNGKIDRRALPDPVESAGRREGVAGGPPRTVAEKRLAAIWSELLGVSEPGTGASFFELGGHSLLATQAVSRIRAAFGIELPLKALFETPTIAGLAARLDTVAGQAAARPTPPILPAPRTGDLPLSFAQERLWFLDCLEPGSPLYNVAAAVRLSGPLDADALAAALAGVVRRHESLRTRFAAEDGRPRQVIEAAAALRVPRLDLRGLPAEPRAGEARRLRDEEARRPFDLAAAPLVRATLARLGEEEHELLLTMHHIVSDGWSMGVLLREVAALYGAATTSTATAADTASRPSPLPELPVQYADFALWQRQWLCGKVLESELTWWRERLAGAPPLLALPTDRPRLPVQSVRGRREPVSLGPALSGRIADLARAAGATPFLVLLAGFQAVLGRWAGQTDLTVGSPIANRNRLETEGLIGFFANTLVLRGDLAGDPAFRELLGRVRETTLGAHAHQDLPFEALVQALNPVRDLAYSPLFQVLFALQHADRGETGLPGLALEPLAVDTGTAKFDLGLELTESAAGSFAGWLEHATDLFDAATVCRLAGHLVTLLDGATATPGARLSALPMLSAAEREQVVVEWNRTARAYPRDRCVHELVAEQAARRPEAVAVVSGGERLTYAGLDRRADRLARRLRALGAGPETLVGVCLERSAELIVSLLAVLKAGAAYLPLDPALPRRRTAWMLEEAGGVAAVVTRPELAGRLPEGAGPLLLLGGAEEESWEDPPLAGRGWPRDLAYVLYTSGSTGRPKGVAVEHRAIVRLATSADYIDIREDDVFLQLAPVAFDASTLEIWGALANGARLVVAPPGALSLDELAALLRSHGVTTLWLTAGLFHQMVDEQLDALCGVRQLLAGGDVLAAPQVRRVLDGLPAGHALVNGYGPTENTTFTCCHRMAAMTGDAEIGAAVPIGRPIPNTRVYLLDAGLQPVPPGLPGELYAGGDGLARGYLGRPDLTAERFVPDPYGDGERLYRTGDLARHFPGGAIEFLGRVDNQVKLRGFRVEPGEVEAALETHPELRSAAVAARRAPDGELRLVAWIVPQPGAGERASAAALQTFLRERLPEYMVPSAWVALDELPLNVNGKVDRRALPDPQWTARAGSGGGPRTPVEELVAGLWSELLGAADVGPEDSFFELGGHSLLATQAVSRLRERLGVELPLKALFEEPTVAGLAARIEAERQGGEARAAPPIAPAPRDGELPLSFAQERLWFLDRLEPGSPLYNVAAALRLRGELAEEALARALGEVVRRHESLRTRFAEDGGRPRQIVEEAADPGLPRVDLRALPAAAREEEAGRLRAEARRPFDLGAAPMLRALLLRMAEEERELLLTMHHIASDGWSFGVLLREVAALYPAFVAGRASPLPELAIQYADFAAWQRDWLRGDVLAGEIAWWRERLAGGTEPLELPADRRRPARLTNRGTTRRFLLPRGTSEAVAVLARDEGATPFMVLLAAFAAFLYRYTGRRDIAVGSPIANRNRAAVEPLIGFFVNTLVLRQEVDGEEPFRELIQRAREVTLGAYEHQDVPFEKLVDELHPERDLAHTPLFQVLLVLQNTPLQDLRLPGVEIEPRPLDTGTAKFDLTLAFEETAEGLAGAIEARTDLFEPATVERMLRHFETLLGDAAAEPGRPASRLALLSAAERREIVSPPERAGGPETLPVHLQFEAWAVRAPEAPAVLCGDTVLSYAELARRAAAVASRLRALGAGPGAVVGLFAGRSAEAVAGVLGILQAGAAYLPLDPSYPAERLERMLRGAAVTAVAVQRAALDRLPGTGARIVLLEDEAAAPASLPSPQPEHPAYVIYTSGSTGTPKGVMVPHRALSAFNESFAEALGMAPGERLLMMPSLSFDASVGNLFPALTRGAALAVPLTSELTGEELRELCERLAVTVVDIPAALWKQWVEDLAARRGNGAGEPLPALRRAVVGGEGIALETLRRWADLTGRRVTLIGAYGPTEATVCATVCRTVDGAELPASVDRVPIGRPLPHAAVLLLDGGMEPVPPGVPGEVYLGGAGVALGYLGQPAATAERFVPHPFAARPGERLYRTGDLARRLAGGTLEFLGRTDHQIKIRGYRIEPGDIEAALLRHPGVGQAAVTVREDQPGRKRLVAYVVPAASPAPEAAELRAFLQGSLPDFMIPAAVVHLDRLPLTPNGKVSFRELPPPESAGEAAFEPPGTPAERALAAIWSQVLGVRRVGRHDNFFELGGDSILSLQIVSRARDAGLRLDPRQVFEHQTLGALASAAGEVETTAAARARGELLPPAARPLLEHPDVEDAYPLSPVQHGMLFHSLSEPESGVYVNQVSCTLRGALYRAAFRRAWDELAARHPILRTAFVWEETEEPVQVVRRTVSIPWEEGDARDLDEALREERRRGFRLAESPLMRLRLVRLGDDLHRFVWSHHHLLLDGWSVSRLLRDLFDSYDAFRRGAAPPEAPSHPYGDYIAWLQRQDLGEAEAFWRRELRGFRSPTPLGALALVAPAAETGLRQRRLELSAAATAALEAMARRRRLTPGTLVSGAWALLLGRLSDEDDPVFGLTVSGRPPELPGVEAMVGPFINTLPLRVNLAGQEQVLSWLMRLQDLQLELRRHEHSPLVRVHGWSEVPPGVPLFESILVFENHPVQDLRSEKAGGLEILDAEAGGATNYPLTLTAMPGSRLLLHAAYEAGRFDGAAVQRLLGQLGTVLEALAGDPAGTLEGLPWLTAAERFQVLAEWNDTGFAFGEDRPLHEILEEQAARAPDAVAVVFEGEALTFRELDQQANQLARFLRRLGVGPEARVGVCLERSLEMVVSLLAALKAGGAYVPLEPAYPAERVAIVLEDARPAAVLTLARWRPRLAGARLVCLDEDAGAIAAESRRGFASGASAESLAYAIFTSGSTGRPKGAMNSHRGIVNRLLWMQRAYGLTPGDRVLQKTPFGFDVSVWELFWPLMTGARLVMARPGLHQDSAALAELIAAQGVTTVHFVPSMLQAFVEEPGLARCRSLRRVICSGEALPFPLQQRFFARCGAELHNLYGPTEAAVDVTFWACRPDDPRGRVPIGRPISNLKVHVLDRRMEPVAAGALGEAYLGGVGLGRGYLGRPDLTAERFVPHPFAAEPGARLYRSGDLARYLPDGAVEYAGRTDHQVKIRGFRIELGEIEAALALHPGVREAVVVARDSLAGDPRLVAYWVAAGGEAADTASLRRHLAERLPEPMVPSVFVVLPALPLNASGKVDQRALPEPEAAAGPPREIVPPRNETERRLAEVWSEVLGVEPIGVHDNFFELGGHSLTALKVVSRLRHAFPVELTLPVLLQAPTVAQLAERLAARTEAPARDGAPDLLVDTNLDADFVPVLGEPAAEPAAILLTGATGFLGAYLLAELLRRTGATVNCLVRAADDQEASRRLRASLEAHQLWDDALADRIVPWAGDLARPRLGLAEEAFAGLAETVDAVYHNGALVSFAYPYATLRPSNVLGTKEVLRLACLGRPKRVHYISSVDVFSAEPGATALEDDPLVHGHGLPGGYLQTKWVAERLVLEAARRGLPAAVYRPGRIAWHSRTGAWNDSDALYRILAGCLRIGCAPRLERALDLAPVDYVSRAIVQLSLGDPAGAFHIVHPRPATWDGLIESLIEAGAPLRRLPFDDWHRELLASLEREPDNPLQPLLALSGELSADRLTTRFTADCRRTLAGLAGSGIACPDVDEELAKAFLATLRPVPAALPESGLRQASA